ncbi:MAG: NAD(P)/FAD-dependent oxidoreductase [Chloroflexota bacterium]
MNNPNISDVVVIGGGPAGSTVATLLAKQGHQVTVLEKEKFPREHVGESLLPFCYEIFEELGVLDELATRFARKPGVRFIDVNGAHHTTWCFAHVIKDDSYLSFHVRRAEFDKLLLDNARKHGATVHEETRVKKADLDTEDGLVTITAEGPNGKQQHRARFLIDASGRDTFLANRMRSKRPNKDLNRAALSTHWLGAKYVEGIEEGLLQIVYLGGEKKGWIWIIPLDAERISIGVVLNHEYIRSQKKKFDEEGIEDWQRALYLQELESSDFAHEVIADAHIAEPLMFNGNYSYYVDQKYGDNFALIGDAGTFIDPILASGVYLSINSARLVANALHESFTQGNGDRSSYLEAAYDQINGAYLLVNKAINFFYDPRAINFAQAGSASELIHQEHENAMALGHYILAGDFFKNHKKYSEFFDVLQNPKTFHSYKNLVMKRPEFQSNSCAVSRTHAFQQLIDEQQMETTAVPAD